MKVYLFILRVNLKIKIKIKKIHFNSILLQLSTKQAINLAFEQNKQLTDLNIQINTEINVNKIKSGCPYKEYCHQIGHYTKPDKHKSHRTKENCPYFNNNQNI